MDYENDRKLMKLALLAQRIRIALQEKENNDRIKQIQREKELALQAAGVAIDDHVHDGPKKIKVPMDMKSKIQKSNSKTEKCRITNYSQDTGIGASSIVHAPTTAATVAPPIPKRSNDREKRFPSPEPMFDVNFEALDVDSQVNKYEKFDSNFQNNNNETELNNQDDSVLGSSKIDTEFRDQLPAFLSTIDALDLDDWSFIDTWVTKRCSLIGV